MNFLIILRLKEKNWIFFTNNEDLKKWIFLSNDWRLKEKKEFFY